MLIILVFALSNAEALTSICGGLAVFSIGLLFYKSAQKKVRKLEKTGLKVEATISKIVLRTRLSSDVFITFTANNDQQVEASRKDIFNPGLYVGKVVEAYYNPNNPNEFIITDVLKWGTFIRRLFGIIGGFFVLYGIIFLCIK